MNQMNIGLLSEDDVKQLVEDAHTSATTDIIECADGGSSAAGAAAAAAIGGF